MVSPFTSVDDFVSNIAKGIIRPDHGMQLYAIIDLTQHSTNDPAMALAGIIAFQSTSVVHKRTEIGYVAILPEYQRTHVTTNSVGLMLQHAFEKPDNGGMGTRRVTWEANSANVASQKAAERLGFVKEGVLRWYAVFENGKKRGKIGNGRGVPPGGKEDDLGRDTVVFSICWDDWEGGVRESVAVKMARTS